MTPEMAGLALAAFAAGFVDAIAGGGGLIQIPALLLLLPPDMAASVALVLGTNKVSSTFGTAVAVHRYNRHLRLPWRELAPAMAVGFSSAWLGASLVAWVPTGVLRPLVLVLLLLVAAWTAWDKDWGRSSAAAPKKRAAWTAPLFAMALGFYDGFFGPGTGSFLTAGFIVWMGCDFLNAAARTKAINLATNLGALLCFALAGKVSWEYGLPMAACNIAGGLAGAELAIAKGSVFVRRLFLAVTLLLILKLGWDIARS